MKVSRVFTVIFLSTIFAAASAAAPSSVKALLEQQGFGGSQLHRRAGNHLFATTFINGRRTALMIDTGAVRTLLDWGTIEELRLDVRNTHVPVGGVYGWKREHYGAAQIASLVMGNCTFLGVPVTVADESSINRVPDQHLDGLFGAHEMTQFGVIIDCGRQMIYVNPKGPSPAASQKLAVLLEQRGFTRIPMHWDQRRHLKIEAAINGHPQQLTVDTGTGSTLLAEQVAQESGVSFLPLKVKFHDTSAGLVPINIGRVQELKLGSLRIPDAEVMIARIIKEEGAGLLGQEYLSWNFGIIDVGGMNLYLRSPAPSGGKNH